MKIPVMVSCEGTLAKPCSDRSWHQTGDDLGRYVGTIQRYVCRYGTISIGGNKEDISHDESWDNFGEWLPCCNCTVAAAEIMSHCHLLPIILSVELSSLENRKPLALAPKERTN